MADNPPVTFQNPPILPTRLQAQLAQSIVAAGGWLGFDQFMHEALYTPGWGYYANASPKFGHMPAKHSLAGSHTEGRTEGHTGSDTGEAGSDFVTAPEMSPHFGRALARQVAQVLRVTGTTEVWEFGAGTGALAAQLLDELARLGQAVTAYHIVDVSGSLRERQQQRLQAFAGRVNWHPSLPARLRGVVVGNEVLDAMPVKLLARVNGVWHERGVALHEGRFAWADQISPLRPPVEIGGAHDYLTEIHPQAEGFVRTLADRLDAGGAVLLDYGFPEHEYYHPQRSMGTVMCHRGHQADGDALADVGDKDITAHVNFTGIALAGQDAGLRVAGYTSQGRFLLNCGLLDGMENITLAERVMLQRLVHEHEMGELFKVIAFVVQAPGQPDWEPLGFAEGDRSHTL